MGSKPSSWGTGVTDVPPSPTKHSAATPPKPDADAGSPGVGVLSAANGQDVSALTDDDATTQATFTDGVPDLRWSANGSAQRVTSYTLTSGSAPGDPAGWTLEGSADGRNWKSLDTRKQQTFPWRGQTRPFSVARPGTYRAYRLRFEGTSAASLAEVELLVTPRLPGISRLTVTPEQTALTARTGSEITPVLATFIGGRKSDPTDYPATIDWGDGDTSPGTAGQLNAYTVRGRHRYAEPGYYRVTVTVTDGRRSAAGGVGITVSAAATGGITAGFDSTCIGDDGGDDSTTEDASVAADGTVTGSHTWTTPGRYVVHVTVSDQRGSVSAALTVTVARAATPALAPPRAAAPGEQVSLTGSGFTPGESVRVALATPDAVTAAATADRQGRLRAEVSIPADVGDGIYAVTATGSRSAVPATATVPVARPSVGGGVPQVRSTLVLSSATAMPGERITATGTGYQPNAVVTLSGTAGDGSTLVLTRARTDADGGFTKSFAVPAAPGGLRSMGTDHAAAPATPAATSPFEQVAVPHGSRR